MTDDLDTLRPDVAEAVKGADAAFRHEGLFAEPYWQTIRAELLRLAGDNAAMREELLHVPSRSEWHQVNECAEKAEDAIFQISARLGEQREPNMDDADWHTQLIARAQFLANAEVELAALKARIAGSCPAHAVVDDREECGVRIWVDRSIGTNRTRLGELEGKRMRLVVED